MFIYVATAGVCDNQAPLGTTQGGTGKEAVSGSLCIDICDQI